MAYDPNTLTFTVGTDDELNAAIANLDAIGKTGNNNGLGAGAYTIRLTGDITLDGTAGGTYAAVRADGTAGDPLTINSGDTAATVQGSSQLYALNLSDGVSVTIDGDDGQGGRYELNGSNTYNGFFVYNGQVAIQNLTIADAVARGGAGGGGGAGLGGGLFVAGSNPTGSGAGTTTTGGDVTLTNVDFTGNGAIGGSGGTARGGGGLQGGTGGVASGGGGVGLGASNGFTAGSAGLILGAAPGAAQPGTSGGAFGGGAGNNTGGGVNGIVSSGSVARPGGFGGGGGQGGAGGFGGGGGQLADGGFGGGGGPGGQDGGFGGGDSLGNGGGGGLGAGANVFVQQGGSLSIGGTGTLGAGTVTGGAGISNVSFGGAGLGSGLFLQGNQSITLAPGAGRTLTVNGVIADQSGSQAALGASQGFSPGSGRLTIGEGTVVLAPVTAPGGATPTANTFTGGTTLNSGAILDLASTGAAGSGAISFNSMSGSGTAQLVLEQSAQVTNGTFTNTLNDFGDNEALVLRGFAFSGTESYTVSNGVLTVQNAGGQSQSFTLTNTDEPAETTYFARDDGQGGTIISSDLVCYAQGTRIRTMGGEVAVEALRVGDFVVTGSGAMRPIRWIGHRTVACRRHPQASLVMPVRIAAGAFGPGKPARDLTVSPAHALCVEAEGGEVLIPAVRLINGTTVARIEVESVVYWHVELDSHDILLAEGLPAESYLDCGNRGFFANAAVTSVRAVPDERPDGALPFCRPFHEEGAVVEAARARLEQRAQALGWSLDAEPSLGLHLLADGRAIHPAMDGMSANFVLPAGARDVRLVSGTSAPAHVVGGSADDRRLGVSIRRLVLDDGVTGAREIALNDPRLSLGFHSMDRDASGTVWRWTDGAAMLPASLWAGCRGSIRVQIALAGSALPRWVGPSPRADVVAMGGLRLRA